MYFGCEHDCCCGVFDVQVFAARCAGAPHVHFVGTRFVGFDALLDECRNDVRNVGMKLVARTEEVGRNEVRELLPVLLRIDLRMNEKRLLRDAVGRVCFLGVAVPERRLAERNGRELRVRAHGAQKHGLFDTGVATRFDDVGSHEEIVEVQRRRRSLVVADSTDTCREVDHVGWCVFGEHRFGTTGNGEVVVGLARGHHLRTARAELIDHNATEETVSTGDEHLSRLPEVAHAH